MIRIPPLRERREDIPLLIDHFLRKFGYPGQEPSTLDAMADLFRDDEFPGNVRELESKIKKMITFNPELEAPAMARERSLQLEERAAGIRKEPAAEHAERA